MTASTGFRQSTYIQNPSLQAEGFDVCTLPIRLVHPLFASGYMQKGEDDNPTGHRIARDKLVQLHSRRY
ncbi:MAG: hypothetical protein PHI11_15450, partial [Gallionella sp.]|nr:hypothetical protein [Gallionella sp.]